MELDPPPTFAPPVAQPPAVLPIERAAAAFEVILCSGFPTQLIVIALLGSLGMRPRAADQLSAPFVFALTLLDTVLLVGLIALFVRARGDSLREQFLGPRSPARETAVGLALIPASFFVVTAVLVILQLVAPTLRNVPHNPLADLVKTRTDAVIFAFVVMVAGGLREEVQRAFILRRFEQYLGGGAIGLVVFSAVFGLGHLEQGHDVAIATAMLGVFWGAIFLRRRSIVAPMVGHAGFNLLQVAKFIFFP